MSICTKTGDQGTTGLMFNRRVPKNHLRMEACGTIDELNAALGLARSSTGEPFLQERILHVQRNLIDLMGELGTDRADLDRYAQKGFKLIGAEFVAPLDEWIKEIEARKISFKGWATPGGNPIAAALDFARTVARRAERRVVDLLQAGESDNCQIQIYLNRLSDLLWLLARWTETPAPTPGTAGQPA